VAGREQPGRRLWRLAAALALAAACARDSAAPTTQPATRAESAPPPRDPLQGLDAAQRWTWALERFPALARPDRAPTPDFSRFGAVGAKVVLYSPDLAELAGLAKLHKPCAAIELEVLADRMATRIPTARATISPKAKGEHVALELADAMRLGDAGPTALLSELADGTLRYQGTAATWTVVCAGNGKLARYCGDGTRSDCRFCELTLVADANATVQGPSQHHGDGPCPPCPADDGGALLEPLARVAAEQRFLAVAEPSGPSFYRRREACKAARKSKPALQPAPEARTHAVPLHPELILLCDQVLVRGDGARTAASLYESTTEAATIVRWYERATGLDARAAAGVAELRPAGAIVEIGAPEAMEADRCAEPSAPAMAIVRVSTPF
jgi:hypothetical protein